MVRFLGTSGTFLFNVAARGSASHSSHQLRIYRNQRLRHRAGGPRVYDTGIDDTMCRSVATFTRISEDPLTKS